MYAVIGFCPLNFIRGTTEPAPEGYGLRFESQHFETREEALAEIQIYRQFVTSRDWTFLVDKVS